MNRYFIETERLGLRHWSVDDAVSLYSLARDERVGSPAGWHAHASVEESREVIETYFLSPEVFAVELRNDSKLIGCIGLTPFGREALDNSVLETDVVHSELSYWLGFDYWGRGYATEAVQAILRYVEQKKNHKVWLCYFESNFRSARVAEKNGFVKQCVLPVRANDDFNEREVLTLYHARIMK